MALIGRSLRDARGARGISIEQAAQDTRISPRFLQALESERFDELPAPVYVRGFLRSYANYLHLDPEPLISELSANGAAPGPGLYGTGPGVQRSGPRGVVPADSAPPRGVPPAWAPQAPTSRPQRGRADPFQRRSVPEPAPADEYAEEEEEGDEEEWQEAEAAPAPPRRRPAPPAASRRPPAPDPPRRRAAPVPVVGYDDEPADDDDDDDRGYPRARLAGVLLERQEDTESDGRGTRLLAILGIAIIVVLGGVIAVLLFSGRGNGGGNAPAAAQLSPTPGKPTTVVALGGGSATPSTAAATATSVATASATATAPATASVSASPTATPLAATPTPRADTPTPTPTPDTPTPTVGPPTPTPVPPTPTPRPNIGPPTPTPLPSHPYDTELCRNAPNFSVDGCGTKPYLVVCPPDHSYYVIPSYMSYPTHGWPTRTTSDISAANRVCP